MSYFLNPTNINYIVFSENIFKGCQWILYQVEQWNANTEDKEALQDVRE
jgi:hypothetical protein